MHQVVGHDIAPANFIMKHRDRRELTFLAAFVFIVIVLPAMLLYPVFKQIHFCGIRKNHFKKGFFLNRLKIVVNIMVEFMPVADNFGGYHTVYACGAVG